MERTFIAGAALALLGAVALQSAEAKDRKSAAADRDPAVFSDTMASREAPAKTGREDTSSAAVERSAVFGAMADKTSANRNGTPTAPLREQESGSSSALRLKFGAITVQPAIGGIKGAKFSIGF